jgi:hypothetical protein
VAKLTIGVKKSIGDFEEEDQRILMLSVRLVLMVVSDVVRVLALDLGNFRLPLRKVLVSGSMQKLMLGVCILEGDFLGSAERAQASIQVWKVQLIVLISSVLIHLVAVTFE